MPCLQQPSIDKTTSESDSSDNIIDQGQQIEEVLQSLESIGLLSSQTTESLHRVTSNNDNRAATMKKKESTHYNSSNSSSSGSLPNNKSTAVTIEEELTIPATTRSSSGCPKGSKCNGIACNHCWSVLPKHLLSRRLEADAAKVSEQQQDDMEEGDDGEIFTLPTFDNNSNTLINNAIKQEQEAEEVTAIKESEKEKKKEKKKRNIFKSETANNYYNAMKLQDMHPTTTNNDKKIQSSGNNNKKIGKKVMFWKGHGSVHQHGGNDKAEAVDDKAANTNTVDNNMAGTVASADRQRSISDNNMLQTKEEEESAVINSPSKGITNIFPSMKDPTKQVSSSYTALDEYYDNASTIATPHKKEKKKEQKKKDVGTSNSSIGNGSKKGDNKVSQKLGKLITKKGYTRLGSDEDKTSTNDDELFIIDSSVANEKSQEVVPIDLGVYDSSNKDNNADGSGRPEASADDTSKSSSSSSSSGKGSGKKKRIVGNKMANKSTNDSTIKSVPNLLVSRMTWGRTTNKEKPEEVRAALGKNGKSDHISTTITEVISGDEEDILSVLTESVSSSENKNKKQATFWKKKKKKKLESMKEEDEDDDQDLDEQLNTALRKAELLGLVNKALEKAHEVGVVTSDDDLNEQLNKALCKAKALGLVKDSEVGDYGVDKEDKPNHLDAKVIMSVKKDIAPTVKKEEDTPVKAEKAPVESITEPKDAVLHGKEERTKAAAAKKA